MRIRNTIAGILVLAILLCGFASADTIYSNTLNFGSLVKRTTETEANAEEDSEQIPDEADITADAAEAETGEEVEVSDGRTEVEIGDNVEVADDVTEAEAGEDVEAPDAGTGEVPEADAEEAPEVKPVETRKRIPLTEEELANAIWLQDIVDEFNEGCSIEIYVIAKDNRIVMGEPITLAAVLYGYENTEFILQWQESADDINWHDIPGADDYRMTVVLDDSNNGHFWRVHVNVTDIILTDAQLDEINESYSEPETETEIIPEEKTETEN